MLIRITKTWEKQERIALEINTAIILDLDLWGVRKYFYVDPRYKLDLTADGQINED